MAGRNIGERSRQQYSHNHHGSDSREFLGPYRTESWRKELWHFIGITDEWAHATPPFDSNFSLPPHSTHLGGSCHQLPVRGSDFSKVLASRFSDHDLPVSPFPARNFETASPRWPMRGRRSKLGGRIITRSIRTVRGTMEHR